MIEKIKKIKLTIIAPEGKLTNGIDYNIEVKDDATIVDTLGALDKKIIEGQEKSVFPLYKGLILNNLQLVWNAEKNRIFEDCAIQAYGPNKEFMPLKDNVDFNLYPNSEVLLSVHAD